MDANFYNFTYTLNYSKPHVRFLSNNFLENNGPGYDRSKGVIFKNFGVPHNSMSVYIMLLQLLYSSNIGISLGMSTE